MIVKPSVCVAACDHPDCEELRKFECYLRRRKDQPSESIFLAYAEVYGEIVFVDEEDRMTENEKRS